MDMCEKVEVNTSCMCTPQGQGQLSLVAIKAIFLLDTRRKCSESG